MSLSYLQRIAGMPLWSFWFILCFQFDGNLSHLIAMASLYFTKPHGEDEAKIKNNELGYTFRLFHLHLHFDNMTSVKFHFTCTKR